MKNIKVQITLFLLFLTSCNSTKLLDTNFGRNSFFDFPDLNLPGDPVGDRISWNGLIHEPRLLGHLSEHQGQLILLQTQSDRNRLGFVPVSTIFNEGFYEYTWRGKRNTEDYSTRPLIIQIKTGEVYDDGKALITMNIGPDTDDSEHDRVRLTVPVDGGGFDSFEIGHIRPDAMMTFAIVIDIINKKYWISFQGNTHNGFHSLPESITFSSAPSLWYHLGSGATGMVFLDDISIFHLVKREEDGSRE
ncbi:hypothetical protein ATE84_2860 [Aquimarina sp. MAR_2010_214]|uniref:hypothetical protein n=1 Tax=Aquimarina sp. MAR_2010_214 TaxID=1250026 RepID=UPI000C70E8A0|nr:hypothetical protein [Aquimarina sp. MAR_2010_214]PKV50793.1 hypothetical protein ATE84_2860 [Aquimarina sp. MAR_2010_214]